MSFDDKTLRNLIPDSLFSARTADGVTDFEEVERRTQEVIERLSNVQTPTVPAIPSTQGFLRRFLPKLPSVKIPSRAELEKYVSERIEQKKQEQQERLILSLVTQGDRARNSFTVRNELINKASRITRRS